MYNEIENELKKLDISIKALRKTGTEYANAEREYKIALRQEALKMRDEGVAVTLIDKCVYGVQAVADKRFERDVAEAVYKANLESINAIKLTVRIMENQLSREWGSAQ